MRFLSIFDPQTTEFGLECLFPALADPLNDLVVNLLIVPVLSLLLVVVVAVWVGWRYTVRSKRASPASIETLHAPHMSTNDGDRSSSSTSSSSSISSTSSSDAFTDESVASLAPSSSSGEASPFDPGDGVGTDRSASLAVLRLPISTPPPPRSVWTGFQRLPDDWSHCCEGLSSERGRFSLQPPGAEAVVWPSEWVGRRGLSTGLTGELE